MSKRNSFRHSFGGQIDRSSAIRFSFDGVSYGAYQGDTLASALLANGVRVVGRSFKYHRPRGIFAIGVEEPSAMVQLRSGPRWEPNLRATEIEVYDGLEAVSQNRWPSLRFDIGYLSNLLSAFLPSGFYYKTFMWPKSKWMFYEKIIRAAAGLGKAPTENDPDSYSKLYQFCDVLIVGGGPAGIAAALSAGASKAKVILVDESWPLGGRLKYDEESIDGKAGDDWLSESVKKLKAMPNVHIFTRTTAFGCYDDNMVVALERVADHCHEPQLWQDRQKVHWIRARQIILATGSIERSIPFDGNDRPGVMLAGAARGYARRYAARCGKKAVIFTNNDSAYLTVSALKNSGVTVVAVIDSRVAKPGPRAMEHLGDTTLKQGFTVVRVNGYSSIKSVSIARTLGENETLGSTENLMCDSLCISGGWTPTVHLFSHAQGKLEFSSEIGAYVPAEELKSFHVVGSANGAFALSDCLAQGTAGGVQSAAQIGMSSDSPAASPQAQAFDETPMQALWRVPSVGRKRSKRFVDIQNDVTIEDIELAHSEGYVSVEHLKRYTTLGMGTDQGRTSNINGLANLADLRDLEIPQVGHTTFRPPYTPVGLGALANCEYGHHLSPLRRTALHDWHCNNRAKMHNTGVWQRAYYYLRSGEQIMDAINREAMHVRNKVGIADVSTLGGIDIQGRDAAEFLERVYINRWTSLPVGRVRYGLMLREDGFVFDDGTATRISENEFYMTTTTANAGPVMEHLEFYAQTVWPDLHVHLTSVTDQWGGIALAGPHSRDVLSALIGEEQASNDNLPYMSCISAQIDGIDVRVFRVSFSGELGFEIHIPWKYTEQIWKTILGAGQNWDIAPYGMEALTILRIEKGHVVSAELDGRTTAADLGFAAMMKKDKDFVGKRLAERSALVADSRKHLVGVRSTNGRPIPKGAQIVEESQIKPQMDTKGHVTSSCHSPNLDQHIGLALIANGRQIQGKVLYAASALSDRIVPVEITHHIFLDPAGERTRG